MALSFVLTDDDEDDREIFREALLEVGRNVKLATFESASSMLKNLDKGLRPDLVFLDINLPQVSGWECLKKIRSKNELSGIPVVMYSTSSYQRDVQIAEELGAIGLITKPSDFELLKKILTEIVSSLSEGHTLENIGFIKKPEQAN